MAAGPSQARSLGNPASPDRHFDFDRPLPARLDGLGGVVLVTASLARQRQTKTAQALGIQSRRRRQCCRKRWCEACLPAVRHSVARCRFDARAPHRSLGGTRFRVFDGDELSWASPFLRADQPRQSSLGNGRDLRASRRLTVGAQYCGQGGRSDGGASIGSRWPEQGQVEKQRYRQRPAKVGAEQRRTGPSSHRQKFHALIDCRDSWILRYGLLSADSHA